MTSSLISLLFVRGINAKSPQTPDNTTPYVPTTTLNLQRLVSDLERSNITNFEKAGHPFAGEVVVVVNMLLFELIVVLVLVLVLTVVVVVVVVVVAAAAAIAVAASPVLLIPVLVLVAVEEEAVVGI